MDLTGKNKSSDVLSKDQIELIQQQETEYKLIGQILRRRGLNIYAYIQSEDKIVEIKLEPKDTCYLKDDLTIDNELSYHKLTIDPRNIHFEALNMTSARKRVDKWLDNKIDKLNNLRKPTKNLNIYGY